MPAKFASSLRQRFIPKEKWTQFGARKPQKSLGLMDQLSGSNVSPTTPAKNIDTADFTYLKRTPTEKGAISSQKMENSSTQALDTDQRTLDNQSSTKFITISPDYDGSPSTSAVKAAAKIATDSQVKFSSTPRVPFVPNDMWVKIGNRKTQISIRPANITVGNAWQTTPTTVTYATVFTSTTRTSTENEASIFRKADGNSIRELEADHRALAARSSITHFTIGQVYNESLYKSTEKEVSKSTPTLHVSMNKDDGNDLMSNSSDGFIRMNSSVTFFNQTKNSTQLITFSATMKISTATNNSGTENESTRSTVGLDPVGGAEFSLNESLTEKKTVNEKFKGAPNHKTANKHQSKVDRSELESILTNLRGKSGITSLLESTRWELRSRSVDTVKDNNICNAFSKLSWAFSSAVMNAAIFFIISYFLF